MLYLNISQVRKIQRDSLSHEVVRKPRDTLDHEDVFYRFARLQIRKQLRRWRKKRRKRD